MFYTITLLAGLAGAAGDAEPFHVQPYLQWPEAGAITVMWETVAPNRGEVRYGTSPELELTARESDDRTVHELRLTGLLPRTRYFYRVSSGEAQSELLSFRTPPRPGEPWRLVVYGDSRSFPDRHRQAAQLAAQFEPDLIVHTGDQVTRGTERPQWKTQFFDPAASLFARVPVVTSLGNHEQNAGNYYEYLALPGNEQYFSLDYADLHLIILDSNEWGSSVRDTKQFQWLEQDLARPRNTQWTAVAFHHPLFSAHDTRSINPARWDLSNLFEKRGMDVVLTGHDHFYYRSFPIGRIGARPSRGIPHITTAGGGAPLYRMKERSYTAVQQSVHHISVLDFDGDVIRGKAVDIAGAVIDEYEITKEPTPAGQLCAYEVYELERDIRNELETRAPFLAEPADSVMWHEEIRVPHQFQVPVQAELAWSDGWEIESDQRRVHFAPGEPAVIRLSRPVSLSSILAPPGQDRTQRLPHLQLKFTDDRFRNRTIEFSPIKIAQTWTVRANKLPDGEAFRGWLDSVVKTGRADQHPFVHINGSQPSAVPVHVQVARSTKRLFAAFAIKKPPTKELPGTVEAKPADNEPETARGNHARWLIADGDRLFTFVVTLDGRMADSRNGDWSFQTENWTAHVARESDYSIVVINLPSDMFQDPAGLKTNAVYSDPSRNIESCLSPSYNGGNDPDLNPDFRFSDRVVERYVPLLMVE